MHPLSVSQSGSKHAYLYENLVAVKIVIITALTNFRGIGPSAEGEPPYIDNNFPEFKGTHKFITVFKTASHLSVN